MCRTLYHKSTAQWQQQQTAIDDDDDEAQEQAMGGDIGPNGGE
jgi:hypothetical protein